MDRLILRLLFVAMTFAAVGFCGDAQGTLRGIEAVSVEVTVTGVEGETSALAAELRTAIELRLRQSRIKVLAGNGVGSGQPALRFFFLFHRLGDTNRPIDGYATSAFCQLLQDVMLQRNRYQASAATWHSKISIGVTNSEALRESARSTMTRMVEEFLNDFLSQNPM